MSDTEGRVFNIQKFSIHDGPGIRTVVFLKGCPLACSWCSNPNSRKLRPLMIRDANDPNVFLEDSREYRADEVVRICLQDLPFYEESGGGVTLSGGEPLVQHRFATTLLKRLQAEGVHTAIETTGYVANAIFTKALQHCNLVIMDVKHFDKDRHKRWTGVANDLPLSNLALAIQAGVPVWARIPVIPGVNDAVEDAPTFAAHLLRHGVTEVQLLPFHQYGERKYELLGWDYDFDGVRNLHEEDVEPFRQELIAHGVAASFEPPESATTARHDHPCDRAS
ncbi:glycyl-radical enzyme activating protein [Arachnia propionica]|uniref:Glycyl-radical enzyme activating protein n=1 Tax=Arachnia propionica TaxID=1750 RepID=A0A3P1T8I2_9ACTN|nr:glycyl-radical enzyme activating protein [Arachnia propionica]RRD04743.1 glycyl-radical enzyme activating protein [Arachnia propionica]